ncbi:hypothetical protein ACO0LC_22950 [Undibacterium sp. JH2W]|uniref:hypothetical protein n=1 Tax=Undibacterium sp. JH2W TaxID=3413037 RepID=UPI003BF3AC96
MEKPAFCHCLISEPMFAGLRCKGYQEYQSYEAAVKDLASDHSLISARYFCRRAGLAFQFNCYVFDFLCGIRGFGELDIFPRIVQRQTSG